MKYAHTKPKNYVSLRASIEEARNRGAKQDFKNKAEVQGEAGSQVVLSHLQASQQML